MSSADDDFVFDKYEAFLRPRNAKVDVEKLRGIDKMKIQLSQINLPLPNNGTNLKKNCLTHVRIVFFYLF